MAETAFAPGRTVVIGERELATGFRLIGLKDVVETTPERAAGEFQRLVSEGDFNLVIASETVRGRLSESQLAQAEASLKPLVVFVPSPGGTYEVASLNALAKRVLGVSLAMPK